MIRESSASALASNAHPFQTRTSLGPQRQATQIGERHIRRTTNEAAQSASCCQVKGSGVSSFLLCCLELSSSFDPRQVDGTKWADLVSKGIRIKVPQAKGSSWKMVITRQGCSGLMLAHQVAAPSWCDTLNAKNAEALLRNDAALEEARKISLAELAPQFFREALGVSGAGMIPACRGGLGPRADLEWLLALP